MRRPWLSPCAVHRTALHDFVDHRAGYDPGSGRNLAAALDHLERCRDCEQQLAATALVIAALRRLADDVDTAEPPPDSWHRLSTRLEPPRPRRSMLSSPIAGLALSAGLVVAIVAPQLGLDLVLSTPDRAGPLPGADAASYIEEQRWLRDRLQGNERFAVDQAPAAGVAETAVVRPRDLGPDGVQLTSFKPHFDAPPGRQH